MSRRVSYILLILTVALAVLVVVGCGADGAQTEASAETGHEGHDLASGEHGQISSDLDWCAEHAVPESECTQCNPELVDHFKKTNDWCAPHDLPESHCRLCNPGISFPQEEMVLAQAQESGESGALGDLDWCAEHAVPESECTQCNPELVDRFKETNDWCAPHDLPESHCRLCNPGISFPQEEMLRTRAQEIEESGIEIALNFRPNAEICATDGALIQFAAASTVERAGISVHSARASELSSTIEAPAEVVFDEARATVVTTTVPALVSRWLVSPGDQVQEGDVLAILQSPEIAKLKSDLVSAQAAYRVQEKELERHRKLREGDLISEADFERQEALAEQARAELVSARGLLLSAGLSNADLDEIVEHGSLSNRYALRAPADGALVDRIAKLGELLEAGRAFAMVADPSSMWIEASLTEHQIRQVEEGRELIFASDGRGLHRVGGEVIWVSRMLDPHTRTGIVRARVVDPNHQLQAGEFGRAHIVSRDNADVTLVPRDAVQWEGCCNVVFVKETDTRYRPHKVSLIDSDGPFYQVGDGVRPGDEVVVNGAFLLKTELKKSSIGAGCCGLDPVG